MRIGKSAALMGRSSVVVLLLAAAACTTAPPPPRVVQLGASLSGMEEVPPNSSLGTGRASMSYDRETHQLNWSIAYQGLSGPLQAAHFHGPAREGVNAGAEIPITVSYSPLVGAAILTPEQADMLLHGRMYVNLHTPMYPGGEIRGQVSEGAPSPMPPPPPRAEAAPPPPPPGYGQSSYGQSSYGQSNYGSSTYGGSQGTTTYSTSPGGGGTVTTVTPTPDGGTTVTTRPAR